MQSSNEVSQGPKGFAVISEKGNLFEKDEPSLDQQGRLNLSASRNYRVILQTLDPQNKQKFFLISPSKEIDKVVLKEIVKEGKKFRDQGKGSVYSIADLLKIDTSSKGDRDILIGSKCIKAKSSEAQKVLAAAHYLQRGHLLLRKQTSEEDSFQK